MGWYPLAVCLLSARWSFVYGNGSRFGLAQFDMAIVRSLSVFEWRYADSRCAVLIWGSEEAKEDEDGRRGEVKSRRKKDDRSRFLSPRVIGT